MPIKVSIVTTGTDFPRNSRAQWEGDIGFDYSNVSKVITVANTETSCEQAIYFAVEDALTAHRTANLEKIVGLMFFLYYFLLVKKEENFLDFFVI